MNFMKMVHAEIDRQKKEKMKGMSEDLARHTPSRTGETRRGWMIQGNSIVNHTSSINHLNQGSSKQAPSNFVERTLLSTRGVRPDGTIVRSI